MSTHLSPATMTSAGDSEQGADNLLSVDENEILSGALLSSKHQFTGTKGQKISVNPLIVDFSRLLTGTSKFVKGGVQILPGIANKDLLHAVVGLYDVSLGDMTPDIIYNTVSDKLARTIILVKDIKDTLDDLNNRKCSKGADKAQKEENPTEEKSENIEEDKDVLEVEEATPSKFEEVYSDTDEEEEESEEEDEEDFSKGINTFIKEVKERRNCIKNCKGPIQAEHIGIEHRIVAAATFTKTYIVPSDRVVHLKFISVRKRFRGLGVGKYLLYQLKDSDLLGSYDAIVVHADNSAVQFFQKYGFSDDVMLNTRWTELAEEFTNCTLMCYLPPFSVSEKFHGHTPELDLITMEKEIKKWREKSLDAYRSEMSCMNRMRVEIIHLKAMVTTQKDLIKKLTEENKELRQDKFVLEREFMTYRLHSLKTIFSHDSDDEHDALDTHKLIKELEDSVKNRERSSSEDSYRLENNEDKSRFMISGSRGSMDQPYCHGKDTAEFYTVTKEFEDAMKMDKKLFMQYEVKMVTKAIIPEEVQESYNKQVESLNDKENLLSLYFCGSLDQSDRLQEIVCEGFKPEDFIEGDFGKGLYFSKYPSKAAQFSALGKLLLTEVAVGNVCNVADKNSERVKPNEGFDSILTPGRLLIGDGEKEMAEEYVIFDARQAIPLHLIEYAPQKK